jgi:hypothetical protein
MPDLFVNRQTELDSPAYEAFPITANGSELDTFTRSLYIGNGGTVEAIMANGGTVIFSNVGDGQILPIRVKAIGTVTTASEIVGLA